MRHGIKFISTLSISLCLILLFSACGNIPVDTVPENAVPGAAEESGVILGTISNSTTEDEGEATFTVKLKSEPALDVSVALISSNPLEGIVTPLTMSFTKANWSTAQTVTVIGVDDDIMDGSKAFQIEVAATFSEGTANESTKLLEVGVINLDNDAPILSTAAYDWSSAQLVLTGTNLINNGSADNYIDASMITITGRGGSYTLTDTIDTEVQVSTSITLTLSQTDQLNIHGLLNRNGLVSSDGSSYKLAAADNWLAGSLEAADISDSTVNGIEVSNVKIPTITSAVYDADSCEVQIIGTNMYCSPGAANDVDISQFTFTGGMGGSYNITASSTSDVELISATEFSFILSGPDKTNIDLLLDQLGTSSIGGITYYIAAADNWLTAADSVSDISDALNAITVTILPTISSASYNAVTGILTVAGSNIQANGGGSDIDASMFTIMGEGNISHTLTDTSDVERNSISEFTLTLSSTDKAAVNLIINKTGSSSIDGTIYNLAAGDDWNTNATTGDSSDILNALTRL